MPFSSGSTKPVELSWDSFATPTPEATSWQPDPDSVPVAGKVSRPHPSKTLPDERQKQALKRQKLLGLPVAQNKVTSPNADTWSTLSSRNLSFPCADVPFVAETDSTSPKALGLEDSRSPLPANKTESNFKLALIPTLTDSSSVSTVPIHPLLNESCTPAAKAILQASESSHETSVPAWARPLAHILCDPLYKPPSSNHSSLVQEQSEVLPKASIPPHIRKHRPATNSSILQPRPMYKPARDICQISTIHDMHEPSNDGAETDIEPKYAVKDVRLQKAVFESVVPERPIGPSQGHERYLQIKLIGIMEDEMDTQMRTTRRELSTMTDKEFASHFDKTISLHKHTWKLQQKSGQGEDTGCRTFCTDV